MAPECFDHLAGQLIWALFIVIAILANYLTSSHQQFHKFLTSVQGLLRRGRKEADCLQFGAGGETNPPGSLASVNSTLTN